MSKNENKKEEIHNTYGTVRRLSKLTQQQMADEFGCTRDLVSKWETEARNPSPAAVFSVHALHYLIETGQLKSFKDHRHKIERMISNGLTTNQIEMLIEMSNKS
ncbi:helix-turn-helix domain-containing protein [Vibrio sonorensis]|uniref:helix-turn-helix domain-containing protein n=1 Tax=Vibrio sonorensis TaxID=1004316 RepID=UPI0015868BB4|nr:helix-turn-helix transcriptional regulator [Vibrio sonorensis]